MFATLHTNHGDIRVELFPDHAPKTVRNFVGLATGGREWTDPRSGKKTSEPLYDGVAFHRIISGFMCQGGDPTGTGRGGPGYRFDDELPKPGRYEIGSVAMANAGPNTNGSQFFITHVKTDWLDGKHTVFGQVRSGQDVVDAIKANDTITRVTIQEGA